MFQREVNTIKEIYYIIAIIAMIPIGIFIGITLRKRTAEKLIGSAEFRAQEIVLEAEKNAEGLKKEKLIEAKEEVHHLRNELEKETKERRAELQRMEKRVLQKEETLDKKSENLEKKDENLNRKIKDVEVKQTEVEKLYESQVQEL